QFIFMYAGFIFAQRAGKCTKDSCEISPALRGVCVMSSKILAMALVLAVLLGWGTQPVVSAEFKLDTRFQDGDGDMVADTPTDPSKWVDPATLIFAYTPVEDPAVYAKVWKGFLEHMEKVTGKKVQFFSVQSNAAQIEAMRAGRLHIAGFNTGSNPIA